MYTAKRQMTQKKRTLIEIALYWKNDTIKQYKHNMVLFVRYDKIHF